MRGNNGNGKANGHTWNFFRAGGFDQVRLETGADLMNLDQLDQRLWVALSCPTRGLEFDGKTLDLIDTDKDGRIRVPEIVAAVKWAGALLKEADQLTKASPSLPLDCISDQTDEGRRVLASARQILVNLGKPDAGAISVEDTTDTARIFAQTRFNGDGIIPADSADDPAVQAVIEQIIACLGSETDRSGKPGVNQAKVDLFFSELKAYTDWWARSESDTANTMPLGDATAEAAAVLRSLRGKIDDYFARCRLAAFDTRAQAALNRQESDYLAIAAKDLAISACEINSFPLSKIEPNKPLPLLERVNPAWAEAAARLHALVVKPLLGDKSQLTEADWALINSRFADYDKWCASKAGVIVEKLGLERMRQMLASDARQAIDALIARDKALEPEANAIVTVDKLVRYCRDLYGLLNNFVSFRDFYRRSGKSVFQAGTLYLDQRRCDLCVRVEDMARHATMAHLSGTYLAYCEVSRKSTGEKMTIAAAFTAGDSDNLMVGRNGIFYDRRGNDWDATITKIVDNPISIRQAFWSPYKRAIRWIEDQIAKRAAAADAAAHSRLTSAAMATGEAATTGDVPVQQRPKIDIGVVAALGVAVGGIAAAFGALLQAFFGLGILMPIGVVALVLTISCPSMLIAWLKLRQRNLGPILDANGWAVNARARINIAFGGSLTACAKLPAGSRRNLADPYAESRTGAILAGAATAVVLLCWGLWYFGALEKLSPDTLPKSGYVQRKQAIAKEKAEQLAKQAKDAQESKDSMLAVEPAPAPAPAVVPISTTVPVAK